MLSFGRLKYDPQHSETSFENWWLILICDKELASYYRYWVEKEWPCEIPSGAWLHKSQLNEVSDKWIVTQHGVKMCGSAWGSHISVIRGEKPRKNLNRWKAYENLKIEFEYFPETLSTNTKHWWMQIKSKQLEEIRKEFGLTPQPTYFDKFSKKVEINPFHLTIGHRVDSNDIDSWLWKNINEKQRIT